MLLRPHLHRCGRYADHAPPKRATWGFGLYCLLTLPTSIYPLRYRRCPGSSRPCFTMSSKTSASPGFALTLEFPPTVRFRVARTHGAAPALVVVLSMMTCIPTSQPIAGPPEIETRSCRSRFGVVFGARDGHPLRFLQHVDQDERARLRWVLIGFGAGLLTNLHRQHVDLSTLIAGTPPACYR